MGISFFWWKKLSKLSEFFKWNLVGTLVIPIVLKPRTRSFKTHTIAANVVAQSKCLDECKKLRFTLQVKDLVLQSLVRTWHIFSVAMLAKNSVWYWEEKDLTNVNLLTTLSAYTFSWSTRTWLCTISLATQKIHSFVAFLYFTETAVNIITTGFKMNQQTFSNLQFRPLLEKFFLVYISSWETPAVEKDPLRLSVSLDLFWRF